MPDRPSRLELARLLSGELDPEQARQLEAQVEASPADKQRLDELRSHVAEYEQVATRELAELRQRLEGETRRAAPWWRRRRALLVPAVALGAVAALLVLVYPAVIRPPGKDTVIFRGTIAVRIVAQRGEAQFIVHSGQELAAGDALRFLVTTPAPGYLTVFSIDGRGKASPFYPEKDPTADGTPLLLERAGQHLLAGSVVLDEAPGPERLFVVFSPRPFDRARVHERARSLGERRHRIDAGLLGINGAVEVVTVGKKQSATR